MTRRHDIDWLRIGGTYLLFVFHVAKVFDPAPFFHIRNADLWFGMLVLTGFIHLWHMPLFFVLAGWSAVGSLRARGASHFARERVLRLLVPLIAGTAMLGPIIKYLELKGGLDLNHRGLHVSPALQESFKQVIPGGLPLMAPFDESFFEFLPTFYAGLSRFTWSHLWFLAYLFTFSLLYLPIFRSIVRRPARTEPLGAAWVYAPVLPLAIFQIVLRPYWPGVQNLYDDWANFTTYSTYLITGFLAAQNPAFEDAVHREWRRALVVALGAMALLVAGLCGIPIPPPVSLAATAVAGWCFIVALMGAAHRYLAKVSGAALDYLSESTLPIYVLHQALIIFVGYFVVQLRLGIAAKFALLLVASVASTMAIYHFIVRRFAVARFLFGMKPKRASAAIWAVPPPAIWNAPCVDADDGTTAPRTPR